MIALLVAAWPGTVQAGVFRYRDVRTIEVELETGPARDGSAIPGLAVPVTVRLEDGRGNVRTTEGSRPRHLWKKLEVEVDGGTWDPERAVVLPDPPGGRTAAELRGGALQVEVRAVRSPGTPGQARRALDWRAVHGPPVDEVVALHLTGSGTDLLADRWLLPGSQVELRAAVVDDTGRTYTTDAPHVRLPWSRVQLTTRGLTPRSGAWVQADRVRADTPYSATVALRDSALPPATVQWTRDWERVDGPAPGDVVDMAVSLVTPSGSPRGELAPGAVTPVLVDVTTREGRVFSTRTDHLLRLPSERLVVGTTLGTWNPGPRTVAWSDALRTLPGREYRLSVAYTDRPDTLHTLSFRPDLLAPLRPWTTPGTHHFDEPEAVSGQAGSAGTPGRPGGTLSGPLDGGPGSEGAAGQAGAPGAPGPSVRLTAWSTTTLDGRHDLVVYVLDGPTGRAVHVVPERVGSVRVGTVGGSGGAGGAGGPGGAGGVGASGCRAGSGGPGGDGGRGGAGGSGGRGGSIHLVVDHSGTAQRFSLQSEPGTAGEGGRGGAGGPGGAAGQVAAAPEPGTAGACVAGSVGVRGSDGPPGAAGAPGGRGAVRVRVDPAAVHAVAGTLPPELREALP